VRILARSLDQIVEEMRQYANSKGLNIKDFTTNPVAMTKIETSAHQIEILENKAETIRSHFFIDDTPDEYLDRRLSERGLPPRFSGARASGVAIAGKGSPFIIGSSIYKDTVFKTLDGNVEIVVTADTNIIIGATSVSIPVQCTQAGTDGNLPPNIALTYSGVAINEVETIRIGPDGLSGGLNAETPDEIRLRLKEDMKKQATSANKIHCEKWAKEVPGVGDAFCIPLWNGDNTSKVVIVDKDKKPASAELVQKVQDYIDPGVTGLGDGAGPIGLYITVAAADELQIVLAAKLILDPNFSLEKVKVKIESSIAEYLKSIVFKENVVRYNHIGDIIYNTEGIIDYSDFTINGGTANIVIPKGSAPVLGVNAWTT